MAEEEQPNEMTKEDALDIESRIKLAMRSRIGHFKEQADSLTFEGVRRLLEKDLGFEAYGLDVHKRFIKQCLVECLDSADNDVSKNSRETGGNLVHPEPSKGFQSKKDVLEPNSEDEEKMEDSPVMGLLTGHKPKRKSEDPQGIENKVPSESTIKEAIRKRASYFRDNSEKVTMAGVRRLLEEDLKLHKNTLDPFKKYINEQLDEVLKSPEVSEATPEVKKKSSKKNSNRKASEKIDSEGSSDSFNNESDKAEETKSLKKLAQKVKAEKKRKWSAKDTEGHAKKKSKPKEVSEETSDADDGGSVSEGGHSQSSNEKTAKRKDVQTPMYGKRVEHLKSIIKSCGIGVPPSIYKRVKQVPENKREARLIKELEEILAREGLSSHPSEKEIKEVRKKKERAKELEGIDMSNIVCSSRRRSTTSLPPPKPVIPVENKGDGGEDSDNDDDEDEDDEEDGNESQSEEDFEEDNDDDSE